MVTPIAELNLSRVTNADWLLCRSKEEKEIDWLSDYYSKHAIRTFIPSKAFHDTIGDASRRQRFFLNVQVRREQDTLSKQQISPEVFIL